MRNQEFILKSGVKLSVTMAPFEAAVALVEAVKKAAVGLDPGTDVGDVVVMTPEVRKALYLVFDTVLYDTTRVTPGLFDDPKIGEKARGDYFEICARVIEVNSKPFFLTPSSVSTTSPESLPRNPASP